MKKSCHSVLPVILSLCHLTVKPGQIALRRRRAAAGGGSFFKLKLKSLPLKAAFTTPARAHGWRGTPRQFTFLVNNLLCQSLSQFHCNNREQGERGALEGEMLRESLALTSSLTLNAGGLKGIKGPPLLSPRFGFSYTDRGNFCVRLTVC